MRVEVFDEQPASRVFMLEGREQVLACIVDGTGSWGTGVEAAEWNRRRLLAKWERAAEWTLAELDADVRESASQTPHTLRDPDSGWSFCATVLVFTASTVSGAAAGFFAVELIRGQESRFLYRPRMLVDQLVESGQLAREAVPTFQHKNMCLGPFVGDHEPVELETFFCDVRRDDTLTVTDITRRLVGDGSVRVDSAQALATQVRPGTLPAPTILVRW